MADPDAWEELCTARKARGGRRRRLGNDARLWTRNDTATDLPVVVRACGGDTPEQCASGRSEQDLHRGGEQSDSTGR